MLQTYDTIVVGGGHAGCEAAAATARLGSKTLLITMDMTKMAAMSCNPAVGGIAKGQIVREIDALGGYMGVVTDMSSIQFRMLNKSKGAAMWSPRSQADKFVFVQKWREILENTQNLDMWQDSVTALLFEQNRVVGVRTMLGIDIHARTVILTNGTFLNGLLHVGRTSFAGGRIGEPASYQLSDQLRDFGFEVDRMKTGTPARIDGRTIDFTKCVEQPGDKDLRGFSYLPNVKNELPQLSCFMTYTNAAVHEMLKTGFDDSPMYNGTIQSLGPRYCPSIETKLVTFADKEQHQLFLEPEGAHTHEYYVNGFSSSLPAEVQYAALQLVPGLEHCKIYRPGYAIEYDFFQPTQLHISLETKAIENLFFAGQINGTTGYEEAAAQGLIAGINAHRKINNCEPFVLKRDEAYIGVLIDDLVSKGVNEPYRMFTSRAEFRILLRQDNADYRLTPKGIELGLVDEYRRRVFENKYQTVDAIIDYVSSTNITQEQANPILEGLGSAPIKQSMKISALVARPNVSLANFALNEELYKSGFGSAQPPSRSLSGAETTFSNTAEIFEAVEIAIKYAGYIEKEKQLAEKIARLDYIKIKDKIPYATIMSLSIEARQKLAEINPETIGQASRISGVSPADVSVLLVYMGR